MYSNIMYSFLHHVSAHRRHVQVRGMSWHNCVSRKRAHTHHSLLLLITTQTKCNGEEGYTWVPPQHLMKHYPIVLYSIELYEAWVSEHDCIMMGSGGLVVKPSGAMLQEYLKLSSGEGYLPLPFCHLGKKVCALIEDDVYVVIDWWKPCTVVNTQQHTLASCPGPHHLSTKGKCSSGQADSTDLDTSS